MSARTGWAAVAAGAALVAGASLLPAADVPAPAASGAVASVTRVCPGGAGQLGVAADAAAVARATLDAPGATTRLAAPSVGAIGADPVRLSAPLGTRFSGTVQSTGAGADQGLSLAACAPARAEHWFAGVRAGASAQTELVLVNLDATPADVNVAVLGPDGPLAAAGGRGVTVDGRTRRVLPLGPLVAVAGPVTLHVTASSGRVAAFVRERTFAGLTPAGADWLAPAAQPATVAVLPVVADGAGARTLVLGNPGERTAQVRVQVLGADGPYAPVGLEEVAVPAGATRTFALEKALQGQAVALRVTSEQEVLAAVEAQTAGDVAAVGGVRPLGQAASATIPVAPGGRLLLGVANPGDRPAHVEWTITDAAGAAVSAQAVDLPAGAAVQAVPRVPASAVLTVRSDDPGVRAAVAESAPLGGVAGLAVLPLEDASAVVAAVEVTRAPGLGG